MPTLVLDGVTLDAADPRKLRKGQEKALADVTCVIGPGESVGLLGNRGSGKSALVSVVLGEARPKPGTVYVRSQPAIISKVSAFIPDETIEFNMIRILQAGGLAGSRLKGAVREIAAEQDVAEILDTAVQDCEGVEIDRTRLACVLATGPELVIVDDPRFRLSQGGQGSLLDDYLAAGGSLLVTADDPKRLGQRVKRTLWLDMGRLVGDGPARVVARNFNSIAVAEQEGDRTKARQLQRRFRAAYVPTTLVFTGSGRRRAATNTETQP